MDISNEGSSIYHRLLGLFQHTEDGILLFASHQVVRDEWQTISSTLQLDEQKAKGALSQKSLIFPSHGAVTAYSFLQPDTHNSVGLLLSEDKESNPTFEKFFTTIILTQLRLCVDRPLGEAPTSDDAHSLTERIVELFDTRLRYAGINDQWDATGRAYFTERVRHFVTRGIKLELCLPAFPCKSSNTDKVLSTLPDRGEMMALEWLHAFVEAVEEIYPRGAKLWIVSDGHVFSDCIGADDVKVDGYTARLRELNDQVSKTDRIGFKSLVDIFSISASSIALSDLANHLELPEIPHHITTEITTEAELCRRILMSGSHASSKAVRRRIEGQDKSILALYRGFSRFMLEDLELHPATRVLSKTKRRKVATAVSFEMIMRNQAYSNLVEMIFPNHIRLSIHAHPNTGPKFGITLFDPTKVRTTSSLSLSSGLVSPQQCSDLLHIPTPWHNCVVELPPATAASSGSNDHAAGQEDNGPRFLVTKAKVVREALSRDDFEGDVEGGELQRCWRLRSRVTTIDAAESGAQKEEEGRQQSDTSPASDITSDVPTTDESEPESRQRRGSESETSVDADAEVETKTPKQDVVTISASHHTKDSNNTTSVAPSVHDEKADLAATTVAAERKGTRKKMALPSKYGKARAVAMIQRAKDIWRFTILRGGHGKVVQ